MRLSRIVIGLALCGLAALPSPSADAACGCTGMTLNHAGTTGWMCSNNNLNFLVTECAKEAGSATNGCAATTYAYKCNLGVNTQKYGNVKPYQKTGFMPLATLSAGSTAADCTVGQVLQETITSSDPVTQPKIIPTSVAGAVTLAGNAVNVDNDATHDFPQVGATGTGTNPQFGGDNYAAITKADVLFSVTANSIGWWDNPDQSKDKKAEVANWKFRFISFVNGTAGKSSCACAFDITVDWKANTDPSAAVWAKNDGLSTNCTF